MEIFSNEPSVVSLKQTLRILTPQPKSRLLNPDEFEKCSEPIRVSALELLSNYGSGLKMSKQNNETDKVKFSTEEVMRRASAWFIEFPDRAFNPYSCGHDQEAKDIQLAHVLLALAEKLNYQQFESAGRLLSSCEWIAFPTGSAVERVVYHFARALRERLDAETGRRVRFKVLKHEVGLEMGSNLTSLACHQVIPFTQVTQFAAVQAILEAIGDKRSIHLIDFCVRSGVQWTGLMQALDQNHNISHLKLTSVGVTNESQMEETGRQLESFAATMRLNFQYMTISIPNMFYLRKELFQTDPEDILVIYAPLVLRTMLHLPLSLEHLMRVIHSINPDIMVVTEVEADHNSPSFVKRFVEALFFYSAYFDCLEECMERESECRMKVEARLSDGILNMVAAEGEERVTRNVKMEVWRAFFERFGMVECEISEAVFCQVKMVAGRFGCGGDCEVGKDGLSLMVAWKGTPIHSLSVWKFGWSETQF
ncbi:hypothetical protein QQ045_028826 [Rhodiola kirilowii]